MGVFSWLWYLSNHRVSSVYLVRKFVVKELFEWLIIHLLASALRSQFNDDLLLVYTTGINLGFARFGFLCFLVEMEGMLYYCRFQHLVKSCTILLHSLNLQNTHFLSSSSTSWENWLVSSLHVEALFVQHLLKSMACALHLWYSTDAGIS